MTNTQIIGYVRVSTEIQNTARQEIAMSQLKVDKLFVEKYTGKNLERPQLEEALNYVRDGDTFVVYSIDRLSRSLSHVLKVVNQLVDRGVKVQFIKEKLVFDGVENPMSNLLLGIFGAFAEFERNVARERQLEGIAIAKMEGKYKGRKKAMTPEMVAEARALINTGVSKTKVAGMFNVSRQTLYVHLGIEQKSTNLPKI